MDFDFDDDQKSLQNEMRRYLTEQVSSDRLRQVVDGKAEYDSALWQGLGELGYLGIAIDEEYGGSGLGVMELCLLSGEIGRSLAPVPFLASICLAATAIDRLGSPAQKSLWLPKLASGEVIGTVAFVDGPGPIGPEGIRASVHGSILRGRKEGVPYGMEAGIAVVVARNDEAPFEPTLFLVRLDQPTVTRHSIPSLDLTQRQTALEFNSAACERLGDCRSWASVDTLLDVAAIFVAFDQVGGSDRALEIAREHALQRFAFGRPIASFQANKHKMADMYTSAVLARSAAYYGAWALDTRAPELPAAAAGARMAAIQAFQLCARECIQLHGGMGFTWELDAHLFYRHSNYLATMLGGELQWGDRLIDAMVDEVAKAGAGGHVAALEAVA